MFSFVQTMQNRMGLPPNLLYDVLRRRESRLAHPGMRPLLSLVAVTLSVPLTLVGVVWVTMAAALGRSASYHHLCPTAGAASGSLDVASIEDFGLEVAGS